MTNLSIIIKDEWSLYRYRDYLYKYFNKNFKLQKLFLYVSENETKGNFIKTLSRINSYFFKNRKLKMLHLVFSVRAIILVGLINFFYKKKHIFIANFTGLGFSFIGNGLKNKFLKFIIKVCLLNFHYVIVQNREDKLEISKIFKKKIFITHGSGYNFKNYTPKISSTKKKINILFASRFIFNKGINDLLEILRLVDEKKFFFNIYLITDYTNNDSCNENTLLKLMSFNNTKVILNKNLSINNFLNNDYFLSLSYREGLSRVLLESINFGLPIIAYNVPGVGELINKDNGFKFTEKNFSRMAKEIEKISNYKNKRISKRLARIIIKPYSQESVLKEYISIIHFVKNSF